ncbi:MAG: histidine kinase [Clostridia bacterium]|nr:histidine kinase [Clostridia bacterium]
MSLGKLRNNSIYSEIFSSFFRLITVLILVILLICYFIINYITIHTRSLQSVSLVESYCNNVTYMFQDDIILCNSLATNDTLIQNLRSFPTSGTSQKVDIDNEITRLFEGYYYTHEEISNIRIFLPLSQKADIIGFKAISYLETYNSSDWTKYFSSESSAIVTEYTCSTTYNSSFEKNRDCIAIIVPVMANKTHCLGFVCMDIRKDKLHSKIQSNTESIATPIFIADIKGNIISDNSLLASDFKLDKSLLYSPSSGYAVTKYKGDKYLLAYSTTNRHGWKTFQLIPYSTISSLTLPILLIFLFLMLVFFSIAIFYSRRRSALLAQPLQRLSDAMELSARVTISDDMAAELQSVYVTYNKLLDNNTMLISEVEKTLEKQRKSETKMLLAQISPHFLYNTLNSIAWKAVNANQPEICSVVSKLAKLFKISYNFTSEFTTLSQELDHIQLYMELQKECFSNKFDYSISLPEDISGFEMPRFVLQPLVENAIIHGFSQIDHGQKGLISICGSADENLIITVQDNGSGIDKAILDKLNSDRYFSEKYGIRNINQRIKLLCGAEYGITFKSNGHSKTEAVITLPIRIKPAEENNL